ncbi:MAG: hypothetical protein A2Y88_01880 [Chloroflexi bacterium RBG_13_48_10]|nr:MAG: hypothetical protein A2Y88_01880 [Chloroflexi bacterium RBG_13_48_10]
MFKRLNLSTFERANISLFEPLAREGDDVAVPCSPGKGERRSEPGSMWICPLALKRNGTGERKSYSALPVPGVLMNIIAQMF